MKKVILFLSVIGTFLMTSCLDGGSNQFQEGSIVYIAEEGAVVYGRSLTGRLITSSQIRMLRPGSHHIIAYVWDEEQDQTTPITDEEYAFNVRLLDETTEVRQQTYIPTGDTPPVEEVDHGFIVLPNSVSSNEITQYVPSGWEQFMGDYWVFEYGYKARKGETANVRFTLNEEASNVANNEAVLDLHLEITGTPEEEDKDPERGVGVMALNMAQLRNMFEGSNTSNTKEVKVKINYYKDKGNNNEVDLELVDRTLSFRVNAN